jgi:hypothetical protein
MKGDEVHGHERSRNLRCYWCAGLPLTPTGRASCMPIRRQAITAHTRRLILASTMRRGTRRLDNTDVGEAGSFQELAELAAGPLPPIGDRQHDHVESAVATPSPRTVDHRA